MQTELSYFDDSYQFTETATITSATESFITLDRTIFYPQGGGQPSDQGFIALGDAKRVDITQVKWVEGEVHHFTNEPCSIPVGTTVTLQIDAEKRLLHARLHTAGHLIAHAVETLYPGMKAVKGHHYPENGYVEFVGGEVSVERINVELKRLINDDHPVSACIVTQERFMEIFAGAAYSGKPPIRLVRIAGFAYQPCGGTHVKSLRELSSLFCTKKKVKDGTLKLSYTFTAGNLANNGLGVR